MSRRTRVHPVLTLFCAALTCLATAPAVAGEASEGAGLPYDISVTTDVPGTDVAPHPAPAPTGFVQDRGEIDDNILLPPARDDDDSDRRWARDYVSVAAGVISVPSYNGSDERNILPAFYLRGRVSGFSFSTRGTNLQLDLIRQKRGQRVDWKFGPVVSLRSDRTGRVKDPQVEALGEKKLAVEAGLFAGVTKTGVITSNYDQVGFRLTALKDVSGRHGSWAMSPTVDYGTPLSRRSYVGVSASMNIYGKGFGRYYFDIDPAGSAASGLPVYDAAGRKATVGKYSFGIAGAHSLSGDLRKGFVLIGGAQYARVTGRYGDSPIVGIAGSRNQWLAGAGIAYQF